MYLVAIAWLYIAVMMAAAEATHVNGSLLGAAITFLLYGLGPVALVLYVLGAPARRKAIRQRDSACAISRSMSSIMSLERPYGFVACNGKLSRMGTLCGSPYTVAEELKTRLNTPASFMASNKRREPTTLLS